MSSYLNSSPEAKVKNAVPSMTGGFINITNFGWQDSLLMSTEKLNNLLDQKIYKIGLKQTEHIMETK
jgi:hypothetical protein